MCIYYEKGLTGEEMERAVFYLRLSREDQGRGEQESESIENQRLLLEEYARKNHFIITGEYADEDYSGLSDERPGFKRMLRDAKKGLFSVILAKSQSRFSRNMSHIERYLHREFPLMGIRFIGVVDGVDTAVAANKKARQIYGLVNEWYCEDLSENVRAVLHRKVREGQFIGSSAPYGYKKKETDRHCLAVREREAATVKRIFELYAEGCSVREICRRLDRMGISPPQAGKNGWNGVTVKRMLTNEVYLGHLLQGKSAVRSYRDSARIYYPKKDWVRRENTHEAIIAKELFEQVQKRLESGKKDSGDPGCLKKGKR